MSPLALLGRQGCGSECLGEIRHKCLVGSTMRRSGSPKEITMTSVIVVIGAGPIGPAVGFGLAKPDHFIVCSHFHASPSTA